MPNAVHTPASQPVVASYCATFLKPEMLHIYRQVTGLRRYKTFVVTRERLGAEAFPFSDVELLPRTFSLKRFYLKYVRKLPPLCYRGELEQLNRLFQRRSADLMHIYFGEIGVHLLPFIQTRSAPSVVSFHGMDIRPRPQAPEYDAGMRELLGAVPLVLARSESLLAGLERLGCPKEKLRLNRTGIPLDQFPFRRRALPSDGEWRFVQACRLIEKKGLPTAVRAFAKFHEKYPKAKFVIAGEGPMKLELEAIVAELGLGGAVELTGFLSQTELRALYDRSHAFLHPSEMPPDQNQEGVPNSMLEAMAAGLPVLATMHGGIPEAVTHERTGLLVGERDAEALFHAMRRMAGEPELFYSLGHAGALAVREEFEHGKQIEKLESYYDEARELFRYSNSDSHDMQSPRSVEMTEAGARLDGGHRSVDAVGGGLPASEAPGSRAHPNFRASMTDSSTSPQSPQSFAYLFGQFPSFVKTFVTREAVEMVKQGMNPWLVSLRKPDDPADLAENLDLEVCYPPERTPLRAEVNAALAAGKFPLKTNIAFRWNRRAALFGRIFGKAADSQRIFEAAWLAPHLRARGIRHVHAHFGGVAARTAWWLRKLFDFQYSFTGHANDIFCETNFPVSHGDLIRDAHFIVTETDYARQWMEKKYPGARGKVFRVFNGIALVGFPARAVKPGAAKVISVGRLVEKKGFDDLIDACRLLRAGGVEVACDIIGAGPLEEKLRAQIDRDQLGATVRLLGPMPQAEVRRRMAEAGIFVLACMPEKAGGSDNLPTVIMEAMACGAPVISTRLAGVPEMIRDGEEGLLVAPRDPAALAEAMGKLLRDGDLAARMGARGRASAKEKFSIENTTRSLKYLLIRKGGITPPDSATAADPHLRSAEFS